MEFDDAEKMLPENKLQAMQKFLQFFSSPA